MKTYMVGGAVRDKLMGLEPHDIDWVVVGATPSQMTDQGFILVGRDFPVFLHPDTKAEYALARTERKTAPGYQGFAVHADANVTLEEDLMRRDLTMNAIAMDESGAIVDPYGGKNDVENKVIRHVSDAFKEDPVRILRVARFAAKYREFTVHESTMELMRSMVNNGEVDSLVSERIWAEMCKALMTIKPSRFFEVLRECGALARVFPQLNALWGVPQTAAHHPEIDTGIHTMMVIDNSAQKNHILTVRFACLVHDLGKANTPADVLPRHIGHESKSVYRIEEVVERFKIPRDVADLAKMVAGEHTNIHSSSDLGAKALNRLFTRCDAYKKPARFLQALNACESDSQGRLTFEERPYPQKARLGSVLTHALTLDTKQLAKDAMAKGMVGEKVGKYIEHARILKIKEFVKAS